MKTRYWLSLLCLLGSIFFIEPLIAKATEVDSESASNTSIVEIPPASIAQVIDSPSSSSPENSTDLIIESPDGSAPGNSTNLIVESPSVSPLLPRAVAEAEGYTLERRNREKQNIEQYQASLIAANLEKNAQQPALEEALPPPDTTPVVAEPTTLSANTNADVLVVESPGEPTPPATGPSEKSVSDQVGESASAGAKKVELAALTFQCRDDNGIATTVAKVQDKDDLPLIRWTSNFFKSAGYDAKARCSQVSARFSAYSKDNPLTYLTAGKMNGQSVVCLTSKSDSSCGEGISLFNGLLFTLRSTDDSQQVLKALVSILQSKTASEQTPIEQ